MRLCRFNNDKLGFVEGDVVRDVTAAVEVLPEVRWPLPAGDPVVAHLHKIQEQVKRIVAEAPKHRLADVRLLSPVANPGKIMAAPANYRLPCRDGYEGSRDRCGRSSRTVNRHGSADRKAWSFLEGEFISRWSLARYCYSVLGETIGLRSRARCGYRTRGEKHSELGRSDLCCGLLYRLGYDCPRHRRSEL